MNVSSVEKVYRNYFNGFHELGDNKCSSKEKFIAFCKVASYFLTLGLLPLGFVIARAIDKKVQKKAHSDLKKVEVDTQDLANKILPHKKPLEPKNPDPDLDKEGVDTQKPAQKPLDSTTASTEKKVDGDTMWQEYANQLPWLAIKKEQGSWREAYEAACQEYKKEISSLRRNTKFFDIKSEVPSDIAKLAQSSSFSVEDMKLLKEWKAARDMIVIWDAVAQQTTGDRPYFLPHASALDTGAGWIERSKGYFEWASKNKDSLSKVTGLELRGCGLSSLKGVEECSELRELTLSYNKLDSFKGIDELKKLKKLDMSNCGLSQLPEEVKGCGELNQLTVSGNKFDSLKGLDKLKDLEALHLSNCGLSQLPEGVEECRRLRELTVSYNKFDSLKGLEKLRNLEVLDLSSCDLSQLPEGIEKFENLETLRFSHNRLSKLPEQQGYVLYFRRLQWLDLSSNGFADLSKEGREELWKRIQEMKSLKELKS